MVMEGMEMQFPDITLADPKEHRQTAINDCSASSTIPNNMLNGTQTGVLAGDKDQSFFLMGQNSRRKEYGTDTIKDVFNRLISFGALPKEKFKVVWTDLLNLSEAELVNVAKVQSEANKNQFSAGQPAIFPVEHIQLGAGVEVESLEMPSEIDDKDIEDDE